MDIFDSTFERYNKHLREVAISRAETRIVLAGKKTEDFSACLLYTSPSPRDA